MVLLTVEQTLSSEDSNPTRTLIKATLNSKLVSRKNADGGQECLHKLIEVQRKLCLCIETLNELLV